MPRTSGQAVGHRLPGLYQSLLDHELGNIDPRGLWGVTDPAQRRAIALAAPRVRPQRLARLQRHEPVVIERWWIGGNEHPEAREWEAYGDRSVAGWEVTVDDIVVPVRAGDPRLREPLPELAGAPG